MEDSQYLKVMCESADTRGECQRVTLSDESDTLSDECQVPMMKKGGVRQVKDGWVGRCLYSQQAGLVQKLEGTHKSDEPVSNTTRNC